MSAPAPANDRQWPARRVVITGMGAVASAGMNATALWEAMREGRPSIAPLTLRDAPSPVLCLAGEVRGFDPLAHFDPKRLPLLDRVSQFALVAAREAVAQSGIRWSADTALNGRTAVIVGTGAGGECAHDEQSRKLYQAGSPRVHPLSILRVMANAPASHVGMEFGITGPTFGVTSACASASHALAQAFAMVRSGQVDAAIAGGTEACLTYGMVKAWESMRVMADDACRPFCRQRRGMVLAEGAGMFVLEPLDDARHRGAPILAELAGCGLSADASDVVFPSEVGAGHALTRALQDAGLDASDVDYINAHGTGTIANDISETRAIRRAFGKAADALSVSSTKSIHGHALGAAGAIELIAAINSLQHGIIPPTANFIDADPECDLDYTPNVARERTVRAALSNSFAFGGLNAVLALRQAEMARGALKSRP
ncbi:MAG: beta-ketoacyl-[acyl-carrier-protein] synthase family protein [Gammaproteobacteria bacterium]